MKFDERVIELWKTKECSTEDIAKMYGGTRAGVKKYLNKHGYDTSSGYSRRFLTCMLCGKEYVRFRCRVKNYIKNYCSQDCYTKSMYNPEYNSNRQGQRIARRVISEVFCLESGHVVHHIDSDNMNNELSNLMVFANQGDHTRWHRCGGDKSDVKPLFDGRCNTRYSGRVREKVGKTQEYTPIYSGLEE